MDDEKIEQVVREKELLTEDQIETVRDALRRAAEDEQELSFLDAAVQEGLLSGGEAEDIRKEVEQEISTCETEDISGAIPAEPGGPRLDEQPAAAEALAGRPAAEEEQLREAVKPETGEELGESEVPTDRHEVPDTEEQPAAKTHKPPYASIAIGTLILIALIVLVAIFNR